MKKNIKKFLKGFYDEMETKLEAEFFMKKFKFIKKFTNSHHAIGIKYLK